MHVIIVKITFIITQIRNRNITYHKKLLLKHDLGWRSSPPPPPLGPPRPWNHHLCQNQIYKISHTHKLVIVVIYLNASSSFKQNVVNMWWPMDSIATAQLGMIKKSFNIQYYLPSAKYMILLQQCEYFFLSAVYAANWVCSTPIKN